MPHSIQPNPHLQSRFSKITLEVAVPKARRSIPEIRRLNRRLRRLRHALPRNEGLLAAQLIRRDQLMINRIVTNVTDFRPRALQFRRGGFAIVSVCRNGRTEEGCRGSVAG